MSDKSEEYIDLCEKCINNIKSLVYNNKPNYFSKVRKIKDIIRQFENMN